MNGTESTGITTNEKQKFFCPEKVSRKYRRDCIHKKIKTSHFRFLKVLLEETFNIRLNIFKKEAISDISITYNKKLYMLTLREFIRTKGEIFRFKQDQEKILGNVLWQEVLDYTLFEFFEKFYYHKDSIFYFYHLQQLEVSESDLYYERYLFYDRYYLEYFRNEKANKQRKDVNVKKPRKHSPFFSRHNMDSCSISSSHLFSENQLLKNNFNLTAAASASNYAENNKINKEATHANSTNLENKKKLFISEK